MAGTDQRRWLARTDLPRTHARGAAASWRLFLWMALAWTIGWPGHSWAADPSTNAPTLFGLTNLWTLHITISAADWQTLGSRGGPNERNFGNFHGGGGGGGGESPGFINSLLRSMLVDGNTPPQPRNQPQARPQKSGGEGNSLSYPWATCTFEGGGQTLTNVAIRFKGASSMVRAPNGYKRPFKLDFNHNAKGRHFLGANEFDLNNNVNDATQMREVLAYELFRRAGLPAPRTAFARVYLTIPGRVENLHLGLYTLVEVVKGDFLKRNFDTKKGMLLKPEMMRGLQYMGNDWDAYLERYHPRGEVSEADVKKFIEFVRFIQEADPERFRARLPDYLDPESFARFVALNAILANVDSFIGNGHNYFLHVHPTSHKATFIAWDLNESFGMHPVSGASGYQMGTSILRPNADPNQLVERFVGDPVLGAMYRAQCAALLTNVFVPATLAADIDRIAAVTKPVVFAESKRARADFERTVLKTLPPDDGDTSQPRFDQEFSRERYRPWSFPDAVQIDNLPLKDWIAGRQANARDQLEGRVRGTRPRPRL
jgi:spore coat protein CotH